MPEGHVTFSTELDNEQLEKDLGRLEKKIMREEEALGRMKFKKNDLEEQLNAASEALDILQKKTKIVNGKAVLDPGDIERIGELKKAIPEIKAEIEKCTDAIHDSNRELEYTKIRAGEVYDRLEDIRSQAQAEAGDGGEMAANRIEEILGRMREYFDTPVQSTKALFEEFFESTAHGFAGIGQIAVSTARKIPDLFKNAFDGALKSIKALKGGITSVAKRTTSFTKNLSVFSRKSGSMGKSIAKLGQMIQRVFVFSAITAGLRAVRTQMSAYLGVNTQFSAALQQLKGVLLTAFQPIYDAVVPALTTLMNLLSRAVAAVVQFTSVLFGTTAKQAQKNAKALYGQAKATKAAGSAAEEAAGSLAGFDEINTIQTEKEVGGGGADVEAELIFDWEYEDTPFPDWGEAFSAFLDRLLSGIPKLKDAFKNLADWLNGLTQKLYDMFTFPGVLEKVEQLGRDLAEALNYLVDQIDWYQLGQALGAGLNLALMFLVNFLYTFDWMNLGAKLAELVNGAVSEINWYAVGQLLWAKFKIAIETLAGFLLSLDMPQLAQAASDIAMGFFDSVTETLAKIDWQEIGRQIARFFGSIDWAGVVESFVAAFGAACGAAVALVWGPIKDAWDSVMKWWHDTAFEDGEFTFQGLLDGIIEAVKGIGTWIYDHIFKPFIDGFKEAFGIHSPSTVMAEMGGYLMDGLFNGINDTIAPVVELFESIFNDFTTFVEGVFTGDWRKAWEGVAGVFKDVWNGIVSTLEGAVNLIIRGINWLISKLNTIHFSLPDWVPVVGGKSFGINIPSISEVQIPRLAKGAVIPPNREFMAVLGDQSHGNNLEAPEELIRKIIREESGGGSAELVQLLQAILSAVREGHSIVVDGAAFGRTAIRTINSVNTAAGKQLLLI